MDYVIALVPPIGLLVILVVVVRAFLGADRSERAAEKKFREEHPDLDLAPLTPNRSTVAGAHAAEATRRAAQQQRGSGEGSATGPAAETAAGLAAERPAEAAAEPAARLADDR